MANLEYATETGSRFRIDNESAICTKIHSDGRQKSFSGYAFIPSDKLEDFAKRYRAMLDERHTDEASLSELLKGLRDVGYQGDKGIMLYLYEEDGSYEIKRQDVKRLKTVKKAKEVSEKPDGTAKSDDRIILEELGIEDPNKTKPKTIK